MYVCDRVKDDKREDECGVDRENDELNDEEWSRHNCIGFGENGKCRDCTTTQFGTTVSSCVFVSNRESLFVTGVL